jgi:hypothetical protein
LIKDEDYIYISDEPSTQVFILSTKS